MNGVVLQVRGSSTCGPPVAVHPPAWQEQPEKAIAAALRDAGLSHSHIGLWATGTPAGGHAAMNDRWSRQVLSLTCLSILHGHGYTDCAPVGVHPEHRQVHHSAWH